MRHNYIMQYKYMFIHVQPVFTAFSFKEVVNINQ